MKKCVDQVDVEGKFVLMRADFNVPLGEGGRITDDRRITQALPTIRNILDRYGRLILMSHLGRPDGSPNPKYSLRPVADRLGELLGEDVPLVDDYLGASKPEAIKNLRKGRAVILENLRFHKEETIKNKDADKEEAIKIQKRQFSRKLADLAEVYINDAFGTCHRDNASMLTVPMLMHDRPKATGFLVKRELEFLGQALDNPARPFVCLLGGAKVSDKIGVIESLVPKCDKILVGGAMAFTFMLAQGKSVGNSRVEADRVDAAQRLLELAGKKLMLPVDTVCASEIKKDIETILCENGVQDGLMGLDIGPQTIHGYADVLATAKTIIWNGPVGVFETPPFDRGTLEVARAIAEATDRGAVSVVGGGDSAAAIQSSGLQDRISHISTGGGASLEYLEGRPFQAINVLDDA